MLIFLLPPSVIPQLPPQRVHPAKGEYPRRCYFYSGFPLPQCPLRRANRWVQDLCKHPSLPKTLHKQKGNSMNGSAASQQSISMCAWLGQTAYTPRRAHVPRQVLPPQLQSTSDFRAHPTSEHILSSDSQLLLSLRFDTDGWECHVQN